MVDTPAYAFGSFRLFPSRRLLLRDGNPVNLTPKAFDALVVLVERRDRVVTREDLMEQLWPGAAVEDGNITQQVFLLRKALDESGTGEQYIATVPRHGYRFVKEIALLPDTQSLNTGTPAPPSRRRVSVAAAVAVLVIAGAWVYRAMGPAAWHAGDASTTSTLRVAVLPFSYQGAEQYAYLGEAMVDLLSRTLDGAGSLYTVDPRAVLGFLAQQRKPSHPAATGSLGAAADPDEARSVAKRLNAAGYVIGEIIEADGRVRISARLYPIAEQSEPIRAVADGTIDDLYGLNDRITAQLAVGGDDVSVSQLPKTAAATTGSIEALKTFLQGEQLFRSGRRIAAFAAYTRAVELDPAFAIGWYRRSQLAYFSGQALVQVMPFAEMSARHSAKVPWRERRLIEGYYAFTRGAARESESASREILRAYRNDAEALFGLALLGGEYGWLLGGAANPRRQELETFLQYQPDDFMGNWLLRNAEAQEGNCDAVESLNNRIFPDAPSHLAIAVFCRPPSERQEDLLRSAHDWGLEDLRQARLWVNGMAGDPHGGAGFARLLDEREKTVEMQAINYLALAESELAGGRTASARRQFARLDAIRRDWAITDEPYRMLARHQSVDERQLRAWRESLEQWDADAVPATDAGARGPLIRLARHDGVQAQLRRYLLGRIDVRLGDYDGALRQADALEQSGNPRDAGSLSRDLALSVRAHVLTAQGHLEKALAALESAPREVPFVRRSVSWAFIQPEERFLRADLLARLGRLEEALKWYGSVHYWPDSVLAAPSHVRQAEIHEQMGHRKDAVDQYRRFLRMWRDCDPEFRPWLDAAEAAVRRLGG